MQLLLDAKCNPNTRDLEGAYPLHHALREDNRSGHCRAELVSILLRLAADVMRRDADADTAFSLASSGRILALCMDEGWERLTMLDVWQRRIEVLVQYVWSPALFITCSSMQKQRCFIQDVPGGSTALCGQVAIDGSSLVSFTWHVQDKKFAICMSCQIAQYCISNSICCGFWPSPFVANNVISTLATTWAGVHKKLASSWHRGGVTVAKRCPQLFKTKTTAKSSKF